MLVPVLACAAAFVSLAGSAGAAPGDVIATRLADIAPGGPTSLPLGLTNVNGTVYFSANDGGATGRELWKSNGTTTTQVADINPAGDSNPMEITDVGGTVFFSADIPGSTGIELWETTGSGATLFNLNTQFAGADSNPVELTNVGGTLLFAADDGTGGGVELYKSDPPYSAVNLVKNINANMAGSSNPSHLTDVNGTLFFAADDGTTNGVELWKSEAPFTAGTTQIVQNINPTASAGSFPDPLTNVGGTLLFDANDGTTGTELWKSNGAGATQVADIKTTPAGAGSIPEALTDVNGTLFFSASDGSGSQLWKSEPPFTSATQVTNVPTCSVDPAGITDVNGTVFFSAQDCATAGRELWKSVAPYTVGTATQVADLMPGPGYSTPQHLTDFNGTLFFNGTDNGLERELWRSNGGPLGPGGTQRAADINPGASASSNPEELTPTSNGLFFRANDGTTGTELWKATIEGPAAPTPTPAGSTGQRAAALKKCKKKKGAKRKKCKKKANALPL